MSEKPRNATRGKVGAAELEAHVFALLSAGRVTHEQIAERAGCSRATVSRIAARFETQRMEAASATKTAALDGANEARSLARDAAPEAVRLLIEQMRDDSLEASDRRDAAKTLLDRAGVTAKLAVEHSGPNGGPIQVETWAQRLARKAAQYAAEKPADTK